jgi:hypothetical protein
VGIFTNPAPGATEERIDQGQDYGGVHTIVAVAAGKIVTVYQNLSGFGQTVIERLSTGQEVYYGEETSGAQATVHPGESVTAGETVASGGSGGGIEVGFWNPSTGHAEGYVPGQTSGNPTPAGEQFHKDIYGSGSTPTNQQGNPGGSANPGGSSGKSGISRPGGSALGTVAGNITAVEGYDKAYSDLLNEPRTAPDTFAGKGWSAPFQWWWQSFTSNYTALQDYAAPAPSNNTSGSPSGKPSGKPSGSPPSGSLPHGGTTHGLVSTSALISIGKKYGWTGQQIADWMNVIVAESNGTLTDTNPSSGAYGIAQFINGPSEYSQYGGNSTTLLGQLTAMANYIRQRYGTPSAAWAHEQSDHWY